MLPGFLNRNGYRVEIPSETQCPVILNRQKEKTRVNEDTPR